MYAEQTFDDEPGEAMDEEPKKKGSGSNPSRSGRSDWAILEAEADEDDPLIQAVNILKRSKL